MKRLLVLLLCLAVFPAVAAVIVAGSTVLASASHTATATNATATVTIAAPGQTGASNVIDGVTWSYSDAPTGGHISVKDGSTAVFEQDITSAGAGFLPVLRKGTAGGAMSVVLSAGGSGVIGYVNASRVYTE